MNRATFLICYLLLALFCSDAGVWIRNFPIENLWTPSYVFSVVAVTGAWVLTNPKVIVPIAVAIAMIVIARSRGGRIGKPWLVWLPVAALSLTGVRAIYPQAQLGYVFAYLIAFGPIVLHLVCVVLGVAYGDAPRATMSQAPPDMSAPTAKTWQMTKYLGIALLIGVIYVTNFGFYPRYFDIAWDEEVQLHDGRVIIVHIKRTFERLGRTGIMGDNRWNGIYRDTEISFDAGPQLGRITKQFKRYEVGMVEFQNGNWYLALLGTTGTPPQRLVSEQIPILILSSDGSARAAKSWDDVPDFPQENIMPLTPSTAVARQFDGTLLKWDQKMAHWKQYPRAAGDTGKIIQRHSPDKQGK